MHLNVTMTIFIWMWPIRLKCDCAYPEYHKPQYPEYHWNVPPDYERIRLEAIFPGTCSQPHGSLGAGGVTGE